MHRRTGTPLSGSFDSAVAGLDEDECVTSAVLEWKYEVQEAVHINFDGLDSMLSGRMASKSLWTKNKEVGNGGVRVVE